MRKFRFGVSLWSVDGRDEWVAKCRRAEELGYDVIGIPDHLGTPAPFPSLAVAAAVTERVRVVPFVLNTLPPMMIAGNSDGMLDLAAREADAVGFSGLRQIPGQPPGTLRPTTADELGERVAFFRERAGERDARIERNMLVQHVVRASDARASAAGGAQAALRLLLHDRVRAVDGGVRARAARAGRGVRPLPPRETPALDCAGCLGEAGSSPGARRDRRGGSSATRCARQPRRSRRRTTTSNKA